MLGSNRWVEMRGRGRLDFPARLCWLRGVTTLSPPIHLSAAEWGERATVHRARAERWTLPAKDRRARRSAHPVEDFLFIYYPFAFAKLEQWHPGPGVVLEGATTERFSEKHYQEENGARWLDPSKLTGKERQRLQWTLELLEATRGRTPNFACHGLHEWAMVYRGEEVRHATTTKLRLPQAEIDDLVESRPIACSHFDAFRFFAQEARPLNRLQPTLMDRPEFEQPGCVHANMDLYKWAVKASPWVPSELVLDCFEQAMALRDLDMRASPYDLRAWGLEPVKIETAEGRREYETRQRALAATSAVLRERLIAALRAVV
jgi:hypothetical protein